MFRREGGHGIGDLFPHLSLLQLPVGISAVVGKVDGGFLALGVIQIEDGTG